MSIKKENVNFVKSDYIIDRLSNDEKIYCEALLNILGLSIMMIVKLV